VSRAFTNRDVSEILEKALHAGNRYRR
jgi:hypothetical protein